MAGTPFLNSLIALQKIGSLPNGREPIAVCGLPLDIVVHVHQVADGAHIIGDVGIAVDGVLTSVMLASPWMVCLMALLATAKLIISMAL